MDLGGVVARAVVSNDRKYCYFRLPKCANSTVVNTLATYDPDITLLAPDPKARAAKRAFGRLLSAEATSLDSLQERYFLFTFVRDPYARLLSAYLDKVLTKDPAQFHAGGADEGSVSFEQFVTYLEQGGLYDNLHWAPQCSVLPVRPHRLDYCGYVEDLDQGLEYVVNRIFGEGAFHGARNREAGRRRAGGLIEKYYTSSLKGRVYELYRQDFVEFGYHRDV
ncbi:sulfotransferase family protein [Ectothiorhodospira sp. BSL-9]|uniref:sulfotransferase family protein n=1 Tax=Ectothiorhodospira sp. BSL-9 TaxID=1442136 RepID=UPI0014397EFF|nr:sulfotransferase family protein [Ectothiorhodospira sp. BSL-9]